MESLILLNVFTKYDQNTCRLKSSKLGIVSESNVCPGLDNLHEYLKFSYPRMRAPSFICENETRQGLTLHYRSKRRGFVFYTMGQIREVARHFYKKVSQ